MRSAAAALLLAAVAVACSPAPGATVPTPVPPPQAPPTSGLTSPPTSRALPPSPTPGASAPRLPASVYYLARSTDEPRLWQVWRLEADGTTKVQLTFEKDGVDSFSVSRADGSLAFVSGNQLFLVDPDGNRRLLADGTLVDPGIEDYIHRGFVGSPSFSPDGGILAYAFDGLHLYDIATGRDDHPLTNLGNLLGEPFVFVKEDYSPGPWSPDGKKLLIIMGYFEGSTLAVMEPGESQPFRRLRSDGPVCCTYHWTPDGKDVLVANASYTTVWPGLWKYDAQSGEEIPLVTTVPGASRFVGWPEQLPSGDLLFFYGERFTPDEGIPLVLARSGPDGQDRVPVRTESLHVADALWAEDGSLAAVASCDNPGCPRLVLITPDQRPLETLVEGVFIRQLAWGP
jgi:hypothetical protein